MGQEAVRELMGQEAIIREWIRQDQGWMGQEAIREWMVQEAIRDGWDRKLSGNGWGRIREWVG